MPPPPEPPPPREVVTGKDGLFAFDNVPVSNVSITVRKAGYLDAWTLHRHADEPLGIYRADEELKPIVLRLAPAVSISGMLRDHNGVLIRKNTSISLWRLSAWGAGLL